MRTPLFFIVLTAKGMRNIPPPEQVMVSCIGLKSPAISLRAIVLKRMVEITIYIQPFFTKQLPSVTNSTIYDTPEGCMVNSLIFILYIS